MRWIIIIFFWLCSFSFYFFTFYNRSSVHSNVPKDYNQIGYTIWHARLAQKKIIFFVTFKPSQVPFTTKNTRLCRACSGLRLTNGNLFKDSRSDSKILSYVFSLSLKIFIERCVVLLCIFLLKKLQTKNKLSRLRRKKYIHVQKRKASYTYVWKWQLLKCENFAKKKQ